MNATVNLGPLGQQNLSSAFLISVGVLTVASIVLTISRVLLSTFILPGKPVRPQPGYMIVFPGLHSY